MPLGQFLRREIEGGRTSASRPARSMNGGGIRSSIRDLRDAPAPFFPECSTVPSICAAATLLSFWREVYTLSFLKEGRGGCTAACCSSGLAEDPTWCAPGDLHTLRSCVDGMSSQGSGGSPGAGATGLCSSQKKGAPGGARLWRGPVLAAQLKSPGHCSSCLHDLLRLRELPELLGRAYGGQQ